MSNLMDDLIKAGIVQIIPVGYDTPKREEEGEGAK